MANNRFVVAYLHDVHHQLMLYHPDGTLDCEIVLPSLGSITGLSGHRTDDELLFNFESFLAPPTTFRYDFATGTLSMFRTTPVNIDLDAYETRQVFYTSQDGTRVPMFITHKKDLQLDGTNPVLLYGYGGFNNSLLPFFATSRLMWLELGGVYAVANLRGGSEYGETWHQAGMLERKQNVFDDFIAAAEWLIDTGYTNSKRLAIMGGSNGGLLVAACMIQRPELFGAVICQVPVIDMLRYHRFTIGRYWTGEYGNAEENPDHFQFLHVYSPLHNVKAGTTYPPTLIATADTDDRVVPGHARKFVATLQAADSGYHPMLLRVEMQAGHGLGKPTTKLIDELSDMYAFLVWVFDIV
ncbi:MAG: S9 family peptidase [Chloroflexi bacterium AL-W]|nr:S9 family peptidase [Chloroflexi bacterium AL-N1]NOK69925.1 S9 family peptidase [Chloroflexi bacterium AL-N10]NOK73779.1 S9 family peptidase [Chloroflexi bacterium AL-N5]NOK85457.1 S9 family peptidase [Chloroflexi bacterium AL-W]NOK91658.1 S9 family peptidase [Chloroflexi bacterium AL-N15]